MRLFLPISILLLLAAASCNEHTNQAASGKSISSVYNKAMLFRYGPYDSLALYSRLADSLAQNGSPEDLAMADILGSAWLQSQSRYRQAMQRYRHALLVLANSDADTLKGKAENGLGVCCRLTGQMDSSLFHFHRSRRIYQACGYSDGQAGALAGIGQNFQQMGELDTARRYILESMSVAKRNAFPVTYLIGLHTLANIYGETGMIDSALAIDRIGIRISDSLNRPSIKATFFDNKGLCYRELGQFDSSRFYFRACIRIDSAAGNKKQMSDSYLNLSSIEIAEKNYDAALNLLRHSLSLARSCGYSPGMNGAWEMMSSVYQNTNRPQEAISYKDSVFLNYKKTNKAERQAMILELETIYDTEKKQQQINSQQSEIERQKIINLGIVILSCMMILLGISYYRRFRQRKAEELKNEIRMQEEKATIAVFEKEQQERMRIARDLHDSIGQMLAVTKMQISGIRGADEKVKPATELIDKTINEVRSITHNLIPEELNFGLVKAIQETCERINASEKTKAEFEYGPELNTHAFSEPFSISVYRIVQEITGNMLRHAEAETIRITMGIRENVFFCTIRDNGKGMDAGQIAESDGIGWRNVRARVRLLNGSMQVKSEKGKGTSVEIKIPQ